MYEKILLELLQVVEMEGIDRNSGRLARIKALHEWMDANLVNVKYSQSIIKNNFTSEEEDALKYHLATNIGEKLMDESISITVEPTKVSAQVVAFKRKF